MEDLQIRHGLVIPGSALEESFARSGGPGGQHVNKTSSKVVLKLDLPAAGVFSEAQLERLRHRIPPRFQAQDGTLVIVTSEGERDQGRNREEARAKLVQLLREALKRPKKRKQTKPTRASKERRIKAKKERGQRKQARQQKWD